MGGLAAEAAGGDFKTGALAAGMNEALVDSLAQQYAGMDPDQKKSLLVMNSQVIGVLTAAAQGNDDAESLQTGAWVAGNATKYNHFELPAGLTQYGQAATSLAQHMQEQGASPEATNKALQAMARGEGFEGPEPAKELLKAWATAMLAGGGVVVPTAGAATVGLGVAIGGGANISYQLSSGKASLSDLNSLDFTDATIAAVVGGLTQGKGLLGTEVISVGGAYIGSQVKGTDSTSAMIGAGVGAMTGVGVAKGSNKILSKGFPDKVKEIMGSIFGGYASEAVSNASRERVGSAGK